MGFFLNVYGEITGCFPSLLGVGSSKTEADTIFSDSILVVKWLINHFIVPKARQELYEM